MCRITVSQDGNALEYVPVKLIYREICLAAVIQDGWALKYVPIELCNCEM